MEDDASAIAGLFETVSLGAPQNAVGFVLWRVMHRYVRAIDRVLRPLDLTHLQLTTLTLAAWMARDGGLATQADLARFGDIHPMQVSNVLKALEQKEMIVRLAKPGNAVVKRVSITTTGLAALRAALPLVIDVQASLFGASGAPGGPFLKELLGIADKAGR